MIIYDFFYRKYNLNLQGMINWKLLFFKHSLIITLISCGFINAQNENESIQNKTYIELFQDLNNESILEHKKRYARIIIEKAKKENNSEFLVMGYHTMAVLFNDATQLVYCDSIIELTRLNSNEYYPLKAYQLKGDYFFNLKDYVRALDNYLLVSEIAKKYKNEKQYFKINENIGVIKRQINEKEEALQLFKANFKYAKQNLKSIDTLSYLNSITFLANIYNDLELADSASYYNQLGFKESKAFGKKYYTHHFSLNEGVSLYYKQRYKEAIDSLKKHIPFFENTPEKSNLSLGYYYLGKSYANVKVADSALLYFKKVDTIFQEKAIIYPISRQAYLELITYYKQKGDLNNQLLYINQLIKVDSLLHSEELYLNKGIFKEYDIPRLRSEKKEVMNKMKKNSVQYKIVIYLISGFLLLAVGFLVLQYNKKQLYKKRFEDIMHSNEDTSSEKPKIKKKLNISEEIVNNVLQGLRSFEKNEKYLSPKVTLSSLAEDLNTNTNYLSKIINHYKGKSFSNYISTLRVEYFVSMLRATPIMRRYTIKAMAHEVGFRNAESFSKAFYKIKGIKPSYFLKELDKLDGKN
ncbi:helix-turn-helix domain-containing protein [Ascidiimonas aurantiaca]|uniref:helix-turn-helix domain-containing protein n=1 Tax=Ascidiimonas aurantiaca TaxID=1685432 RepID=UPI0030EEBD72